MNKILLVFLLFVVYSCGKEEEKKPFWIKRVFSSFEESSLVNGLNVFSTINDTIFISTALNSSQKFSFSEEHSLAVAPNQDKKIYSYPSACKIGQLIEFSIWEKKNKTQSKIKIKLYSNDTTSTYISKINNLTARKKNGWRQHHFEIPINTNIDSFDISVISVGDTIYFDDFKLYIYPIKSTNELTERLQLYIPSKSKLKLNSYLNKAIPERIIPAKSKKYIKAYWTYHGDTLPLKFKIKGDWTDHVQPSVPSLRVKMKNSAFNKLSTFSIQDPKTRGYINEWVFHQLASYIDVLTTEYSFINVTINEYNYGLYAIEEHFTKHLLESKKRREGPILKMQEDSYWNLMKSRFSGETSGAFPFYESSMISAFGMNRISKNIVLKQQYLEGAILLQKFKDGNLDIEHIFDIDQLAKYYVLNEFSGNSHGSHWHNRRFYFNPITQKLEHIFYDAIPNPSNKESFIEELLDRRHGEAFESLDYAVLRNKQFREKYMYYLDLYTDSTFINSFVNHIQPDYDLFCSAIKKERPNYKHNLDVMSKKGKIMRQNKSELNSNWIATLKDAATNEYWIDTRNYSEKKDPVFIKNIELNTYLSGDSANGCKVTLENFHSNDLTIKALFNNYNRETVKNCKLNGYTNKYDSKEINTTFKPDTIEYTFENIPNKTFKQKINIFPKPKGETTRMKLDRNWNPNQFTISNDTIILSDSIVIQEVVLVPSKYKIKILPGCQLNFRNGGGLIINNEVSAIGSDINPITISCSDSSSNGITVIKGNRFILENANISGLGSLRHNNWNLTGALTIYETECKITNTSITNNYSEDALNIIRSKFDIENLTISQTFSDGFDADFCTGKLTSSSFENTGNDCIDFSGSAIYIENVKILNSGDKGISAGESSNLELKNIEINGAISGIASKDGSSVNGENIKILNTQTGLIAFQKKLDYSPAKMSISNSTILSTSKTILPEKGSSIIWNGTLYESEKILNITDMYSVFRKK